MVRKINAKEYHIAWISDPWYNRKKSSHLPSTISFSIRKQTYFSIVPWDRNPGNTVIHDYL